MSQKMVLKAVCLVLVILAISGLTMAAAPLSKEKLVLTAFAPFNPSKTGGAISNYGELPIYKILAEKTNITMKFIHPPVGQEKEQLNLMVAAGDFPDVIEWEWMNYMGGAEKAIRDGAATPLNKMLPKYAPNLSRLLKQNPQIRKEMLTDKGTIYCFPFLRKDPFLRSTWGFQLRKDWLDKLGLKVPTTVNEWYTVLKAFKERDPNGNGKADEIPLIATGLHGNPYGNNALRYWTFPWGIEYGFYHVKGVVKYGPAEPEFKDWLKTMNQWYREGLIDPDFISNDDKSFDAKVLNDIAGSWHGTSSGNFGRFTALAQKKNPDFHLVGAPYPLGAAGKPYNLYSSAAKQFPGSGAAITKSNKHVIETVKFLDYAFSPEGHMLFNFGVEGLTYKMVNGYPQLTDLIAKNPKLPIDQAIGAHFRGVDQPPCEMDRRIYEQRVFLPELRDSIKLWATADISRVMPSVSLLPEEVRKYSDIMNEVTTYTDEMTVKFIVGRVPLSKYDDYLQTINKMGIKEAVAMQQASYKRYLIRK